jgi:hypothetical protein
MVLGIGYTVHNPSSIEYPSLEGLLPALIPELAMGGSKRAGAVSKGTRRRDQKSEARWNRLTGEGCHCDAAVLGRCSERSRFTGRGVYII